MGPCGTCRKTAQQAFKLRWTTAPGVWTVITVHGGRTAHHGVALEGGSAGGACAHVKCFGPLWPSRGLRMRVTTTAVGTRSVLALVAVFVLHAYRCHSLKSLVSGTRFAYDTVVIPSGPANGAARCIPRIALHTSGSYYQLNSRLRIQGAMRLHRFIRVATFGLPFPCAIGERFTLHE